jgi:hypothetical protein
VQAMLRQFLGLGPGHDVVGVLVNKLLPLSSAAGVLRERDVLLAYNGEPIGCDGTVHFRGHERCAIFSAAIAKNTGDAQSARSSQREPSCHGTRAGAGRPSTTW